MNNGIYLHIALLHISCNRCAETGGKDQVIYVSVSDLDSNSAKQSTFFVITTAANLDARKLYETFKTKSVGMGKHIYKFPGWFDSYFRKS